jgi:hypothetical protein
MTTGGEEERRIRVLGHRFRLYYLLSVRSRCIAYHVPKKKFPPDLPPILLSSCFHFAGTPRIGEAARRDKGIRSSTPSITSCP